MFTRGRSHFSVPGYLRLAVPLKRGILAWLE